MTIFMRIEIMNDLMGTMLFIVQLMVKLINTGLESLML